MQLKSVWEILIKSLPHRRRRGSRVDLLYTTHKNRQTNWDHAHYRLHYNVVMQAGRLSLHKNHAVSWHEYKPLRLCSGLVDTVHVLIYMKIHLNCQYPATFNTAAWVRLISIFLCGLLLSISIIGCYCFSCGMCGMHNQTVRVQDPCWFRDHSFTWNNSFVC